MKFLNDCGWEYDRNFSALVKSGRAQGNFVNRYPFPKEYSTEVKQWKVENGVLVVKFQKIQKGPAIHPLPVSWTQFTNSI